jgi:5-(carboxyamino)imidazole ribonucleotide synthase
LNLTNNLKSMKKVGVLGGGQLGKMLAIAASNWHLPIYFLDPAEDAPAKNFSHGLTIGDFNEYETVFNFGKNVDVLTIEIEHVSVEALKDLQKLGISIFPQPSIIEMIQDKGLQKEFFQTHQIPSPPFRYFESKIDIINGQVPYPYVQKARKGGYDGKGVSVIRSVNDFHLIMDTPSIVETCISIKKELAIIGSRNQNGDISLYPVVEMVFNEQVNLVEFLQCPAAISMEVENQIRQIATLILEKMEICGLLAIEFFLDQDNKIWVNEMAPRPHNSGHHTINAHYTSQFEQHLRSILNLPLGSTSMISPSIMINILGEPGYQGDAIVMGLDTVLAHEGVYVHLYGKKTTKPFRKMGHMTIVRPTIEEAIMLSKQVEGKLRIIAKVE